MEWVDFDESSVSINLALVSSNGLFSETASSCTTLNAELAQVEQTLVLYLCSKCTCFLGRELKNAH